MSSIAQMFPASASSRSVVPVAAVEVLGYLCVLGVGALCFLCGWLTPNGAGALTVLLLSFLIVLSWNRFDQGRHPCFLFLCALMFFQGGGLLAYCLGAGNDPLRVQVMTPTPFYLPRDQTGMTLLLLALAAICVYAPCRWNYERVVPPSDLNVRRYLPYLYLVFFATLPVQLFKNYRYYQYLQEHGGYTFLFVNHAALAASVPFLVRVIPLLSFPVFVAIFVFERRRKHVFLVTALYFITASFILLFGSRVAFFSLIPALWYVARIKSTKKAHVWKIMSLALLLLLLGDAVSQLRSEGELSAVSVPVKILALQGLSFNVTEVAVGYRHIFSPHGASYLLRELTDAFIANDASNYYRGRALAFDISVLLSPQLFAMGYGTASSFIAEAYVIGGVVGVASVSILVGVLLRLTHQLSRNLVSLFIVAMVLPDLVILPRAQLLSWVSNLAKIGISVLLLTLGWGLYRLQLGTPRRSLPR